MRHFGATLPDVYKSLSRRSAPQPPPAGEQLREWRRGLSTSRSPSGNSWKELDQTKVLIQFSKWQSSEPLTREERAHPHLLPLLVCYADHDPRLGFGHGRTGVIHVGSSLRRGTVSEDSVEALSYLEAIRRRYQGSRFRLLEPCLRASSSLLTSLLSLSLSLSLTVLTPHAPPLTISQTHSPFHPHSS